MQIARFKVRLDFDQPILGSLPGNKEIFEEHHLSKAPTDDTRETERVQYFESVESHDEELQKASTIFMKNDKGCFFKTYQVKGFFKGTLAKLVELGEVKEISMYAVKGSVDSYLYVWPLVKEDKDILYFTRNGETIATPEEDLQRPLRADTPRGERICLARSEMLHPPLALEFIVEVMESSNPKAKRRVKAEWVEKCLDFGKYTGLGQWRSAGWGRFNYDMEQK